MNEITEKVNILKNIKNKIYKNFKLYIILFLFCVFIGALFQFYLVNKNNKILNTSINYHVAKSYDSLLDFDQAISSIIKEDNFYAVLATLEKIKIKLNDNKINSAYNDYLKLLSNNNLSNNYKSIIAIQGSYLLLGKIDNYKSQEISYDEFSSNINYLLSFIDISLGSYHAFKLEIQYLLSIFDTDVKNRKNNEEAKNLYDEIQGNDVIPSSVKERVKTIHEFQKYK